MSPVYRYIFIPKKRIFLTKVTEITETQIFGYGGIYYKLIKQINFYVSYLITRQPPHSFWYIFIRFSSAEQIDNLREQTDNWEYRSVFQHSIQKSDDNTKTNVSQLLACEHKWQYRANVITVIKVFSPTDAQLDSLTNNFKFALKLTLKSSYMFRCKTLSSGSTLSKPC